MLSTWFSSPSLGGGGKEREVWRRIREGDIDGLGYLISNHKMLAGSPTHSLIGLVYVPAVTVVSALLWGFYTFQTFLLLGVLLHQAIDIVDDLVVLGSIENWMYLPKKLIRKLKKKAKKQIPTPREGEPLPST